MSFLTELYHGFLEFATDIKLLTELVAQFTNYPSKLPSSHLRNKIIVTKH